MDKFKVHSEFRILITNTAMTNRIRQSFSSSKILFQVHRSLDKSLLNHHLNSQSSIILLAYAVSWLFIRCFFPICLSLCVWMYLSANCGMRLNNKTNVCRAVNTLGAILHLGRVSAHSHIPFTAKYDPFDDSIEPQTPLLFIYHDRSKLICCELKHAHAHFTYD